MSDNEKNQSIQNSQLVEIEPIKVRTLTPHQETPHVPEDRFHTVIQELMSYVPKSSQFTYECLNKLNNFVVKQSKERVYYGQFYNQMKHGRGVLVYTNGRVYEGHWENDRKHGYAYEAFASGAVYIGYYANNKPHGVGKYIWANGELYEGEWVNGTKHGNGMWIGIKEDKYVGEWQYGKPHGQGIHSWINGDRYEGEFSECLKQGYGSEKFGNGDQYEGYYSNGKPDGQGRYKWCDGSNFKGTFKNGLRCGQGEYISSKYSYKGGYMNDRKQGLGEFYYTDGKVYRGNFFDDQKHGEGEITYQDGKKVQQQWARGQILNEDLEDEGFNKTFQQQFLKNQSRLIKERINNRTVGNIRETSFQTNTLSEKEGLNQTHSSRFVRSDTPKKANFKPPFAVKSHQPFRTMHVEPTKSDPFSSTEKTMPRGNAFNAADQNKCWPMIPMTNRPNKKNTTNSLKQKSRGGTPDLDPKKILPFQKPEFTLRFDKANSVTLKNQNGQKNKKKILNYEIPKPAKPKDPTRVVVRIRSITSCISGNIRQMTQNQQ